MTDPVRSPDTPTPVDPALLLAALLAVAAPTLLAYNEPPSSTLLNQLLAVAGWGVLLMWLPAGGLRGAARAAAAPLLALVLIGGAALATAAWRGAPTGPALSAAGVVLAAAVVLLVGWHYVKQGFGMATMDAALKRRFWRPEERRMLLANAYVVWACAWLLLNDKLSGAKLFGHERFAFDLPDVALALAVTMAAVTTIGVVAAMVRAARRWRADSLGWQTWPLAGCAAYAVSLYLWTLFVWQDPAYVLVVPFFHSLQYLAVVWRMESNRLASLVPGGAHPGIVRRSLARFAAMGTPLGLAGFWLVPGVLDWLATGRVTASPTQVAPILAAAWIFINIHHYLIDSVLWRQGNPVVSRHLFGAGRA